MKQHSCLICIGSNFEREAHMGATRKALAFIFPDIRFGKEMETEAIGDGVLSPFSNQLAVFTTSLPLHEVRHSLKRVELDNGRTPEAKVQGVVRMDIDLLVYDQQVLKPEDMERTYIQKGLEEF